MDIFKYSKEIHLNIEIQLNYFVQYNVTEV